ncbi:hypothetical protein EBZ39_02105 [bacterium]|nr:hypothetical protein [bacterium]
MSIQKQTLVDQIQHIANGCVQVRTCTYTVEGGNTFHRHAIAPGDDYSAEDAKVQAICVALHTPEVVAAYKAAQLPILE